MSSGGRRSASVRERRSGDTGMAESDAWFAAESVTSAATPASSA
jgi:hypothetical protein